MKETLKSISTDISEVQTSLLVALVGDRQYDEAHQALYRCNTFRSYDLADLMAAGMDEPTPMGLNNYAEQLAYTDVRPNATSR